MSQENPFKQPHDGPYQQPPENPQQAYPPQQYAQAPGQYPAQYQTPYQGQYMAPHRAGMILAFGIISFFFLPFVFGPMAWVMGNNDLREMDAGRMDPSGRGSTEAGRTCGMIGTILFIVIFGLVVVFWFLICGGLAAAGAAGS